MRNINRRDLLKHLCLGIGAGISSRVFFGEASAAAKGQNFVLYIHCGSWDGIGTGLLQPNSVNQWPRGCFVTNADHVPGSLSTRYSTTPEPLGNPLVGKLIASSNHLFSHYSSPLAEISQNLLHVTCAPGSLDHNVARIIQQTGAPSGQPHWVSGLAQLFRAPEQTTTFVINSPIMSSATVDVSSVAAADLEAFRGLFRETVFTSKDVSAAGREAFAEASQSMFDVFAGPSLLPAGFKTTFKGTMNSIIHGVQGISDDSPAVESIKKAFSADAINGKIDDIFNNDDAAGIKSVGSANALMKQFVLAGSLISSSAAHGMVIQMPGEDRHSGGAEVFTSRIAGNLWTQLAIFWKWLESEKLQDRVTVVVTHEFTRTPWNRNAIRAEIVRNGQTLTVNSPGRDHHPVNGLYVLSSKLKSGHRFGGIRDGFAASGSSSLGGAPNISVPAPTTQQALGTIFFTLFDELKHPGQANSARRVRAIWPTFSDTDMVGPLREII